MNRFLLLALTLLTALLFALPALAGDDPLQTFAEGCEKEMETYCKDVTPGEGRILACLYAHNDKISPKCEFAIYDAAAQLERAINAVAYVAGECLDDARKLCAEVAPGEGRILACLESNEDKVSARCKRAIEEVTQ